MFIFLIYHFFFLNLFIFIYLSFLFHLNLFKFFFVYFLFIYLFLLFFLLYLFLFIYFFFFVYFFILFSYVHLFPWRSFFILIDCIYFFVRFFPCLQAIVHHGYRTVPGSGHLSSESRFGWLSYRARTSAGIHSKKQGPFADRFVLVRDRRGMSAFVRRGTPITECHVGQAGTWRYHDQLPSSSTSTFHLILL